MGLQGFDETYYLTVKLESLQALYPEWEDKDTQFLKNTLYSVYGLTPEEHYSRYGYTEGLAPNPFFDPDEYRLAKAADLVEEGSYDDMDSALDAFDEAWPGDLYLHYLQYGAAEGLNPSNNFDESQYLADKLQLLKQDDTTLTEWIGKTVDDLRDYLSSVGLTALGHYLSYGAAEGITPVEFSPDEEISLMPHDDVIIPSGLDLDWVDNSEISTSPYNAIGMVTVIIGNQISFGTGFLISPEHVLTNAHVLLNDAGEVLSDAEIVFLPALNGELSSETDRISADTISLETTFTSTLYNEWPDNDLAIITLDEPIDLTGGYFTLEPDIEAYISDTVNSAGYPIDTIIQDDPATPGEDYYQWEVSGTIEAYLFGDSILGLSSDMEVTAGASGSPVFYVQDGTTYVSGVLSGSLGETTVAAAIDEDSYNWILGVVQQDGYYTDYTFA